jgi:hypothetical protein
LRFIKYIAFSLLLVFILTTMGCGGLLLRHMMIDSDGTYSELKSKMLSPQPGTGRLFVYAVEGGPNPLNTVGMSVILVIDKRLYRVMGGGTYWYIDLPEGEHSINIYGTPIIGNKQVLKFNIENGSNTYCQILGPKEVITFVDPITAEKELLPLDHNNNFMSEDTEE